MTEAKLTVNHVGISFRGGNWDAKRAERIAHLTFKQVLELAVRNRAGAGKKREVELLSPRPVRVSASRGDEEIARAAAAEVYRTLLRS